MDQVTADSISKDLEAKADGIRALGQYGTCMWCCLRLCGGLPLSYFHPRNSAVVEQGFANLVGTTTPVSPGCSICYGILDLCLGTDVMPSREQSDSPPKGPLWESLRAHLHDEGWQIDQGIRSFDLNIQNPLSVPVRERQVLAHALPSTRDDAPIVEFKDAVRARLQPCIEAFMGCPRVKDNRHFCIYLDLSAPSMQADCEVLENLPGVEKPQKRKQRIKFKPGQPGPRSFVLPTWSVSLVSEALAGRSLGDFAKYVPSVPAPLNTAITTFTIQRESVFISGKYQKLSREWPQSPWADKFSTSVADVITDALAPVFHCKARDECKFRGAGREDADVRMLQGGRPFILEIPNPRASLTSHDALAVAGERVSHLSGGCVKVSDLREATKMDNALVTAGEQDKRKTYECVIWTSNAVTPTMLKQLRISGSLTLQQRTPLRVLHRRANLIRPKEIFAMSAEQIASHFIVLRITTGAGTYVKEFVHGDYGRTTPNVGTLLGCEADIIQLDVLSIQT